MDDRLSYASKKPKIFFIVANVSSNFSILNQRAKSPIHAEPVQMKEIPKDIKDRYLVDEDKYRINDPVIQKAVEEAVGDEENPCWIMRKIYKYVRDNLY